MRLRIIAKMRLLSLLVILCLVTSLISTEHACAIQEFTLEELYAIALENSEKIKFSEEELSISERVKDKAISVLLPKLSGFGGYTKYSEDNFSFTGTVIQPDTATLWGIRLDQSFSLSGREITALNISSKGIEKSKYDLFAAKESYLMSLSSAFYDVLKAKKIVDIARANVERLTKHRDAALVRLKVGEVTKTALLRAEAELSGASSELVRAENNLKLTKVVLSRVAGLYEEFDIKEHFQSPLEDVHIIDLKLLQADCTQPAVECLKRTAFAQRAELISLEIQKRIAEEQVKYAKGAYFPTVTVEGVWLRRDEEPASAFLNKESVYGAIKINFPFFEGGLRKAEVREAEARNRQASLLYDDIRKSIGVEVENAYLDFITLRGVLKSLRDQMAFAKDNFNSVTRQFEFGLANSIDVMDANTLLISAERQYSDAVYNFQVSTIRLKKVTGTLLKAVNSEHNGNAIITYKAQES